jgi:hypothetical protein
MRIILIFMQGESQLRSKGELPMDLLVDKGSQPITMRVCSLVAGVWNPNSYSTTVSWEISVVGMLRLVSIMRRSQFPHCGLFAHKILSHHVVYVVQYNTMTPTRSSIISLLISQRSLSLLIKYTYLVKGTVRYTTISATGLHRTRAARWLTCP